jgi:hypothetical protein
MFTDGKPCLSGVWVLRKMTAARLHLGCRADDEGVSSLDALAELLWSQVVRRFYIAVLAQELYAWKQQQTFSNNLNI